MGVSRLFDALGRGPNGATGASAIVTAPPAAAVLAANAVPIAPPSGATLAYFDPYERPIPGAIEFNIVGDGLIGSFLPQPVRLGIFQPTSVTVFPLFTVPANSFARISGLTLYQQDTDETTNYWPIYYSLLLNGGAVPGYSNLPYFPRTSALLTVPRTPYIRIARSPTTIDVTVVSPISNISFVGAVVSGWYWSAAADQQWRQQFQRAA